jgi:SAM-dependent methyltransferase
MSPIQADGLFSTSMASETERILTRYRKRVPAGGDPRYAFTTPAVYMAVQERERALLRWIRSCGIAHVDKKKIIEIGCGSGANLIEFMRFGFAPENIIGNELLPERAELARRILPATVQVIVGDALELDLPAGEFDVVFQSTVFTSILDDTYQQELAARMWRWVRPGGGVLWYDFLYDNPSNPDVRGVRLGRVRSLFGDGCSKCWRVTLAPPISRIVTRLHPCLYTAFNVVPALRTHTLCWIQKI